MTDSTDNARGPERPVLQTLKPDSWPETVHVGKAVIRFPNGVESGSWYSKPDDGDKTMSFVRADLAPDPLRAVKVRGLVWRDRADIPGLHDAESPIGWWYNITETPEGLFQYEGDPALENPCPLLRFDTLEAAKAAAQADYEARIRSALEPDPQADGRVQALVDGAAGQINRKG